MTDSINDKTARESTPDEIDQAVNAARSSAAVWAESDAQTRANLLRALASALESERAALVPLANEETSLGLPRLNGELDRSAFQLRAFADAVQAGEAHGVIEDAAVAGAPPAGRPRLLRMNVALGPVAMFAASNFPFAFSVLGGDTASALAAGCPVVVKAHPAHPRLSRAVFALAQTAAASVGAPVGLIGMVEGATHAVGIHLVRHPAIAAVAFTGSFIGGKALQEEINARPAPIPFYGELGSVNPIVALPAAIAEKGAELAKMLAGSIAQGAGQFCTSPGILFVFDEPATDEFVAQLAREMDALDTHTMLTPGIRAAFERGVAALLEHEGARHITSRACAPETPPAPRLVEVSAKSFLAHPRLREEVFGPVCVVVRVTSVEQLEQALHVIGGALTATVWGAENIEASLDVPRIVRAATSIAGRVLFAGVPTGVAVTRAQHHGGPWPASTHAQSTSVGVLALHRFLRPVALQDAPAWLVARYVKS